MSRTVQQTRTALLDAATRLFSERGYAAVGTREIAECAGANIGSISYHFGSKRELYLHAVRNVMARSEDESAWSLLGETTGDVPAAARQFACFVGLYLRRIIEAEPPQACGMLMLWEAVQPSDAIDDMVRDFIRPGHEQLVALVAALAEGTPREHELRARSVLAQILHYHVFRPFIGRLERGPGGEQTTWPQAAGHIVAFSLRGLGLDDAIVDDALAVIAELADRPLDRQEHGAVCARHEENGTWSRPGAARA